MAINALVQRVNAQNQDQLNITLDYGIVQRKWAIKAPRMGRKRLSWAWAMLSSTRSAEWVRCARQRSAQFNVEGRAWLVW